MLDISREILSNITIYMKYARFNDEKGRRETWEELVNRNKEMHLKRFPHLKDEIESCYKLVLDKKILPSMRSLQFAGKPIEVSPNRIYNCAYMPVDDIHAFSEAMFLLLGGTGVGYSVQRHHIEKLPPIRGPIRQQGGKKAKRFLIGDSIEGWADAIKVLMSSYFYGTQEIEFDYRDIRPKGARLVTSGGKAPGPQPLKDCIHNIKKILDRAIDDRGINTKLKPIEAHDIMCHIADAVLAGGIRRAAMISLFSFDDEEMRTCKYGNWWELNPQRGRANNSAVAVRYKIQEEDFFDLWGKIKASGSGEPGIFFTNDKDWGVNPCAEISLRPFQFCNLVTIKMSDVVDQNDFNERARAAAFIATLQASYTDFHYLRSVWRETTEKEALIGVSMTGLASRKALSLDFKEAANVVKKENLRVSKLIGINKAARTTTVKPEGCLTKDTIVATTDGLFRLDEIGDINGKTWQDHDIKVYSHDKVVRSTKFYVNGKAKTKILILNSGLKIESTHNHKFKVLTQENELEWKEAKDIVVGDKIRHEVNYYDGGKIQALTKVNFNDIRQPIALSGDVAFLIGLYTSSICDLKNPKEMIIYGDNNLEKIKAIFKSEFNIDVYSEVLEKEKYLIKFSENFDSFIEFLKYNNLINFKEIPLPIRKSPKNVISEYIYGLGVNSDNYQQSSVYKINNINSYLAEQVVIVSRAIGYISLTVENYKDKSFVLIMKSGLTNMEELKRFLSEKYANELFSDVVIDIKDGENYTFDIEIDDPEHAYIANSYISHNTSSLVLGTSSGVHAWHAKYYLRRIRVGKNESIYKYLAIMHPELLEDDYFRPETQAIITVPQKAPDDAILRDEGALDLLSRVEKISKEWIATGHRSGSNKNNVSVTVSIKDDEWDKVGRWMWENRDIYTGISVLPYDGGTYIQPPFEEISKEEYEKKLESLVEVDLTKVIEEDETTNLNGEIACGGGSCEIT